MFPVLFEIGQIEVYSFGIMRGTAFVVASYLLMREFRRRDIRDEVAGIVTLLALVGGVVGGKLFGLMEHWDALARYRVDEVFSAAGQTFYGGLIVGTVAILFYLRRKGIPFLRVADATAPGLILAYGIGRVGCQLAGDGDYGIPTDVPWAMTYPEGTVSTLAERNSDLVTAFKEIFPGQAVPVDIPVHPTPVYETLAAIAIFGFLWSIRKRPMPMGSLFALYLILAGIERLLVEFIRLNPLYAGLSQAQWISVGMIIVGSFMLWQRRGKPADEIPAVKKGRVAGGRTSTLPIGLAEQRADLHT